MKRIYFLIAIGVLQILVGSVMLHGAAEPIRKSEVRVINPGSHYHEQFGILGAGRLTGNFSEGQGLPQNQSIDLFVFDDRAYAAFLASTNAVPLFTESGTNFTVAVNLSSAGSYHVVIVKSVGQTEIKVHLDYIVTGLKTSETILALVVLVGGLALVGASLTLSVWSWRRPRGAPADPSSAPSDPSSDPSGGLLGNQPEPAEDDTRIY